MKATNEAKIKMFEEPILIYYAKSPDESYDKDQCWWWRIGNYDPEGPFETCQDAIQSLARESAHYADNLI